jgi:hypothetical protein
MPKGPRGEKRPADVIGAAVKVMRIATDEETEELDQEPTNPAAVLGKAGRSRAGAEADGGAAKGNCAEGGGEAMGKARRIERRIIRG